MDVLQSLLLECEYFPCIAWYQNFIRFPHVLIEQYEYFERTSFRNRCYIAGPNGKLVLSVPLEGGRNQKISMRDLKICNRENWQELHWKTLQTCYNRSPFFEYFKAELEPHFKKQYSYLMELNLDVLQTLNKLLGVKKELTCTSSYISNYEETTLDFRKQITARQYLPINSITYIQAFANKLEFIPGLSVLDILFCEGKHALHLIQNSLKIVEQ